MNKKTDNQEAIQIAQSIASDCIGARVRILNRAISRIYDDMIRPHGIKFSQMNILTVVTLHGPVQQMEVGRMLSFEKSTLSRNVALMEANGWIQSLPGEGNTRLLRATQHGRQLLEKAAPDWGKAQERVTSMLGSQTAVALRRAADRIWEETSWE